MASILPGDLGLLGKAWSGRDVYSTAALLQSHPLGSYALFRRKSTLNSFPATTYGMRFTGKTGTVDRCHGYGEDDPIVMEKSDRRSDTRTQYVDLILIVFNYYTSINTFDERSISQFASVGATRRQLIALEAERLAHGDFPLRTWVNYSVKNPADPNHRTAGPPQPAPNSPSLVTSHGGEGRKKTPPMRPFA